MVSQLFCEKYKYLYKQNENKKTKQIAEIK